MRKKTFLKFVRGINSNVRMTATAALVFASALAFAQDGVKITGKVVDGEGMPLPGVNVLVAGTTQGTITDMDGNYTLSASEGSQLQFSFIGFDNQTVAVVAGQAVYNVTLEDQATDLNEVVVMGYGVQKKKLVTGATVQVKGDDLQKLSTTSALSAMQSQTPGVNIVASSGQPGEGFKVNIRGAGTNGSTTPLYIIDGVEGDINALSPADIESLDVLKDAASAAIYGSRAANGVILITTKQGKAGKMQVSYDGYVGWQNVYKMPDLLDAKQYMQVMDYLNFSVGSAPYKWTEFMSQERYDAIQRGEDKGTNWLDEIRNKNAITTNHAVNIAGGSELSKFSIGVSYMKQDGILGKPAASEYSRMTVRMNSEHVLWKNKDKGFDIVTFGENFYYNHNERSGIQTGNQYANDISWMLRANPIIPVYNEKGEYYMYDDLKNDGWFGFNSYTGNPIASMANSARANNKSKSYGVTMVGYLKVQPIKNLIYKGQFGYKQGSSSYRNYSPAYKINDSGDFKANNSVSQSMSAGWSWSLENTLGYKFDIAGNSFDVLVGQSFKQDGHGHGESMSATANNLLFEDWERAYLSNSTDSQPVSATGEPWGDGSLASFFGRLNYNFNETYMASFTLRADGSSNFAEGNRWGYFPSASVGWVVTNEEFMSGVTNFMNFFKIRGSWGQNGNCNVGNFKYSSTVAFDAKGQYSFNNNKDTATQGGYANVMPNKDITWETSEQLDLGIDARFLDSRLSLAFDYYVKTTKDLLIEAPILDIYGTGAPTVNGGDIENKGIELGLGWNDTRGELTYGFNVNIATNKNEVVKINNDEGYILGTENVLSQGTRPCYRMQEGHAIGYFWGYKTEGVMQNQADVQAYLDKNCDGLAANSAQGAGIQPGDLKFVDVNGDGKITEDDKTEIGNPHPKTTLGVSANVAWKGIDLSVTTYGAFGHQNIRSYRKFADGQYENYTTEVYEHWFGEGTSNRLPRLTPGNVGANFMNISDIYVEDADYFRIQNITLGYDLKKGVWQNCPLQQIRVYFSAQNLATFTKYKGMDPEIGANGGTSDTWAQGIDLGYYPAARTYMVGLNIKF